MMMSRDSVSNARFFLYFLRQGLSLTSFSLSHREVIATGERAGNHFPDEFIFE